MEDIIEIYNKLRKKDKLNVKSIPLENRLILSQLITNSAADTALQYAWVNRALAQSNKSGTSAILSLTNDAPKEQLLARKISKKLRLREGLTNPIEVFNNDDFENFLSNYKNEDIILKQNYPSENAEFVRAMKLNYKNKNLQIANTKEAYNVIESKKCLAKIATKEKRWLEKNITDYLKYVYRKNNINVENFDNDCKLIIDLVSNFLIPTKNYKGNIEGLYILIKKLLDEKFLPVFKFNYSVSGYGVHYPKNLDGKYDINELLEHMESAEEFIQYLTNVLNKNGQEITKIEIIKNIEQQGITIQKYISGHEHSIGYFKPLKEMTDNFSLALTDFVVTDVIVEGTAHCGNVLHYDDNYIFEILKNTKFENKANLLHFSTEIILYLMYLNENLIDGPNEYKNISVEDFGTQFIVNNKTGEVGIIEFNGRSPSCNFNHYHLLSEYGNNFENENLLPTQTGMFTNAKIMDKDQFLDMISIKKLEDNFINTLLDSIHKEFLNKLEIISLQIINGDVTINFVYFLEKNEVASEKILDVKKFVNKIFGKEF